MWYQFDRLTAVFFDATLAALLFTTTVALAMVFQHQPVRRRALARAGVLGLFVLPFLIAFSPLPKWNLFHVLVGMWPSQLLKINDSPWVRWIQSASTAILANSWPGRIASLCCLCGLAIAFFGALAGLLASLWIRSRSVRPSEATLGLYGLLAQKLGQATPPLLVSHRIKSPALVGLGSRFIVLPSNLDRPESRARLELSLLHELAHDQSWDPLFSFLGGMTKSIWFFLPTAWWIVRQMRLDQEYMADSRATHQFGPPDQYAASLLDIADGSPASRPTATVDPSPRGSVRSEAGTLSSLYQRMLMLLQCPFAVESRTSLRWSLGVSTCVASLTIATSLLTVQGSGRAEESPQGVRSRAGGSLNIANLSLERPTRVQLDRPLICRLPITLPRTYSLSTELWASEQELSGLHLNGVLLRPQDLGPRIETPRAWRKLRVVKNAAGLRVEVDGFLVGRSRVDARSNGNWIIFEASVLPSVHLRKLELVWP